jgi:phosphopantothenoylcysteine decarboxylase/phosphopantothenate--cysteine ligase
VTAHGAGFDSDTNIVTLLWPDGRLDSLPQLPKREVAQRLLDAIQPLLTKNL